MHSLNKYAQSAISVVVVVLVVVVVVVVVVVAVVVVVDIVVVVVVAVVLVEAVVMLEDVLVVVSCAMSLACSPASALSSCSLRAAQLVAEASAVHSAAYASFMSLTTCVARSTLLLAGSKLSSLGSQVKRTEGMYQVVLLCIHCMVFTASTTGMICHIIHHKRCTHCLAKSLIVSAADCWSAAESTAALKAAQLPMISPPLHSLAYLCGQGNIRNISDQEHPSLYIPTVTISKCSQLDTPMPTTSSKNQLV